MPVHAVDPTEIETRGDLARAHDDLLRSAGCSAAEMFAQLEKGPTKERVARSTFYAWLEEKGPVPRNGAPYRAFLRRCGVAPGDVPAWLSALERLKQPRVVTAPTDADRPAPEVDEELEAALERWARQRRAQWSQTLVRTRAVDPALGVGWVAGSEEGTGTDLADFVLHRAARRRVLLVGASGGGKSVLLVELALAMADTAGTGASPYPLLLSLSARSTSQRFEEWVIAQLVADDPDLAARPTVGDHDSLAQKAVRTGRVLPVLDGLDEVGETRDDQQAVIDAADSWLHSGPRAGLVVAARREDVGELPPGPRGATVVTVRDVARHEAEPYLAAHAGGEQWAALLDDPAVGEAMHRPFPIALACTAYGPSPDLRGRPPRSDRSPESLRGLPSADAVTTRLIECFLAVVFPADTDRVRRHLATIAGRGRLVWWEVADGVGGRFPLVATLLALPGAVAVGLVAGLDPRLGIGLGVGVGVGVATAVLADVLVRGLSRRQPSGREPSRRGSRGADDIGPAMAVGFLAGLVGALLGGILAYLLGASDDPWRGVVGGLGAGIAAGVVRGPVAAVPGGLLGGAAVAFTAGLGPGWPAGLVDGSTTWLAAGLAIVRHRTPFPVRSPSAPSPWVVVVSGLVCGAGVAVAATRRYGLVAGLVAGVVAAILGGVAIGSGAARWQFGGLAAQPLEVLRTDRRTFLRLLLLGGGALGVSATAAVSPWVGLAGFVIVGVTAGAIRTAWPAFVVGHACLAIRGHLPWRLLRFLDDALRVDVLRTSGAGFELRHRELAEHLASAQGRHPMSGRFSS